jgi:hypothetical protein
VRWVNIFERRKEKGKRGKEKGTGAVRWRRLKIRRRKKFV